MGMQLNIKSDEAYRLATRLAELTGASMTTAVTQALRQCVAAEERHRGNDDYVERVLAAAADFKAEIDKAAGEPLSSNHDWLYDERGLPV